MGLFSATNNSRTAAPAVMALPTRTMARDRIPARQMGRVGAQRRAQPDLARPPRNADGHQREDAQRRQKQHERGHPGQRSDLHGQADIPLPDPCAQRPRVLDEQSGIDIGRNDRQTRGKRGRIATHPHGRHQRRECSRRCRVKHIRPFVAPVVRVQADVAHDAHDLEPRLRRRRVGSRG